MPDFAMRVHFRAAPGSQAQSEGFAGGYGWFLGRFADLAAFHRELPLHLAGMGYSLVEAEVSLEIKGSEDLSPGEQQALYKNLSSFPLQYRTLHVYR
jgi:hypothetical protein